MLGYLVAEGQGEADRLLFSVAEQLQAEGWPLANSEAAPAHKCDMDLHVLSMKEVVRISQNLGAFSKGCRLDPAALETAVGMAEAALAKSPWLCIVNKFGKSEIDGKGFRPLIGEALVQDIPVLTSVSRGNIAAFQAFAEGMGEEIAADLASILAWCKAAQA